MIGIEIDKQEQFREICFKSLLMRHLSSAQTATRFWDFGNKGNWPKV